MTAEYKCLFGISKPILGFNPGEEDDTLAHNVSTVVSSGYGGRVFWFLFGRMDRVYEAHEIPRFNAEDASKFAQEHADLPVKPDISIKLSTLWDAREVATLVTLEEADFKHWTAGRIICLGDSVHKMTPATGAGGMLAMESAAELANALYRVVYSCHESPPTLSQLETTLVKLERTMHPRATVNIKATGDDQRVQALRDLKHRILVPYLTRYGGDSHIDQVCGISIGGSHIDFLPLPPRSLDGFMPFNPTQGIGKEENKWLRAILAFPILIIALTSKETIFTTSSQEFDKSLPFSVDYGIWYAILLIVSARRAHQLNVLRL